VLSPHRSTLLLQGLFTERIIGRKVFERLIDRWIKRQASVPVNRSLTGGA
jgi:hypothetical protein